MTEPKISLVASANKVKFWTRFCDSLRYHKTPLEVIFVGDVAPTERLPQWFRWIEARVKPSQCYEIGFREARGELVHWTADDADYECIEQGCVDGLDRAYEAYREAKDFKAIVAMRTIEDGQDVTGTHRFFSSQRDTPAMAPMGLISRQFLVRLGGYDRRFVTCQGENDIVMRALQCGGQVVLADSAVVHLKHKEVHMLEGVKNPFRDWHTEDRKFLEKCWVKNGKVVLERQEPVMPFSGYPGWHFETQGPKGYW